MKMRRIETYNVKMWSEDIETRELKLYEDGGIGLDENLEEIAQTFYDFCEKHCPKEKFVSIEFYKVISYVADED